MRILYATDHKNYCVKGKVFLTSRIYPIIKRYADVFGEVVLYSRFVYLETVPDDGVFADFVVDYLDVGNLLHSLCASDPKLKLKVGDVNMVVGRVPGVPAYKAIETAKKEKVFSYSEACGCAWDAYWNHGVLGKMLAPYMFFEMKKILKETEFASYVTDEFLQKRYPRDKSSVAVSNVMIKDTDDAILKKRIDYIHETLPKHELTLMTTAAVNVRYKGQQYLIEAIPKINEAGIRVKYYIVGAGDQSYLRKVAKQCNVLDQVEFTGKLLLDRVLALCDKTDIYIQPSLTEGLPRAMIEAMSRACIAVGARSGGIPELVEPEYVVRRKSSVDIANKVIEISKFDKSKWTEVCKRNFEKAREFSEDKLSEKRNAYYFEVKKRIDNGNESGRKK